MDYNMTLMPIPTPIAIVGAGNRVNRFYTEIIKEFSKQGLVRIVGIYNRSLEKARKIAKYLNCPVYFSLEELIKKGIPSAIILAISPEAKDEFAEQILKRGIHLFLETPASFSSSKVWQLADIARQKNVIVEVAEDEAFSPEAQLHRKIIESNILGRVIAVFNDDLEYYYHACARLHILVGSLPPIASCISRNIRLRDGARVEYREILFDSGLCYFHRYVSPKRHLIRTSPDWRVICEHGVMSNHGIVIRQPDGTNQHCRFLVDGKNLFPMPEGQINRISVTLEDREFSWSTLYDLPHWTRQHWGVSHLLRGFLGCLQGQNQLFYGIQRAARDIEIFQQMESPSWAVKFWRKIKSFRKLRYE